MLRPTTPYPKATAKKTRDKQKAMALHAQVLDAFCPEAALVPVGFINIDALRLVYMPERRQEIFRRLVALPGLTSARMLASLVPIPRWTASGS